MEKAYRRGLYEKMVFSVKNRKVFMLLMTFTLKIISRTTSCYC